MSYQKNLTKRFNKSYYDEHLYSYSNPDRSDIKRILQLMHLTKNDSVLEIGCGYGTLLKQIPTANKIGVESNDHAVKVCRKNNLTVIKQNIESKFSFSKNSFSIIIMNEVLSHLQNPYKVLVKCRRALKKNGRIFITAPVRSIFFKRISDTHIHEMTVAELRRLVESAGYRVVIHEVSGLSFLYPLMEYFVCKPFRKIRAFVAKKLPNTKVNFVDHVHALADQSILKPMNVYRSFLLQAGLNQLIVAIKN